MLLVCAISLTFFMLWSMTGLHKISHFFSCWFVASSLISSVSLKILSSSSGSTISLNQCILQVCNFLCEWVIFCYYPSSYYRCIPINAPVFLYFFYKRHYGLEKRMEWFYLFFLLPLYLLLFFPSSLFLFLTFSACILGCFNRTLLTYAFWYILHCLVNFPCSRLSQPMRRGADISSFLSDPLFLALC